MGSDIEVVNAARASFEKQSVIMTKRDESLLDYLLEHNHTSPLRHCYMTFELKQPIVVLRHIWKHCIGSNFCENSPAWNESSRRYITDESEHYIPSLWRKRSSDKKQGSLDEVIDNNEHVTEMLKRHIKQSEELFHEALKLGVCEEQARFFMLGNIVYGRCHWTLSLQAAMHFYDLRESHLAQKETRDVAIALGNEVEKLYPLSWAAFKRYRSREINLDKVMRHISPVIDDDETKKNIRCFLGELFPLDQTTKWVFTKKKEKKVVSFKSPNDEWT